MSRAPLVFIFFALALFTAFNANSKNNDEPTAKASPAKFVCPGPDCPQSGPLQPGPSQRYQAATPCSNPNCSCEDCKCGDRCDCPTQSVLVSTTKPASLDAISKAVIRSSLVQTAVTPAPAKVMLLTHDTKPTDVQLIAATTTLLPTAVEPSAVQASPIAEQVYTGILDPEPASHVGARGWRLRLIYPSDSEIGTTTRSQFADDPALASIAREYGYRAIATNSNKYLHWKPFGYSASRTTLVLVDERNHTRLRLTGNEIPENAEEVYNKIHEATEGKVTRVSHSRSRTTYEPMNSFPDSSCPSCQRRSF